MADGDLVGPERSLASPDDSQSAPALSDAPIGRGPPAVNARFDAIATAAQPANDGSLAGAQNSARAYRSSAKADNTRAAYRSGVRVWCDLCHQHDFVPLPASSRDVAAFLAAERDRGRASNTFRLRAAAIRFVHRAAGLPSPTDTAEVSETMAGIRKDAPNPVNKRAATLAVLRELLAPIPNDLCGLRDRALLLVGFAGALGRSELVGMSCADLQRTDRGYELPLARSKANGRRVGPPALRPHRALPGPRALALDSGGGDNRRPGVPADLAAIAGRP